MSTTKTMQFKRGIAARWFELNPVLKIGEPGFEYDTGRFKIGDGVTPWRNLDYIGAHVFNCVPTYTALPTVGLTDCLYKVEDTNTLYLWSEANQKYEPVTGGGTFDPNLITLINGGTANG